MANIFANNVQRQTFKSGVQDEIRAAIPMAQVAQVDTENYETMYNRYGDDFVADKTTDGTYEINDFEYSTDSLPIEEEAVYGERIRLKDMVHSGQGTQNGWDITNDRINRHTRALGVQVHRDTYTKTTEKAGLVLDNEVLNGNTSAGTPISVSTSNPDEISTKAYELMQDVGLSQSDGRPYFMVDPQTARSFKLYGMNSGFNVSDRQLMSGFALIPTFDFDYYVTPEVERQVKVTSSANVSGSDTVTVKGVTFTYKASPSAAGEVDVGANIGESLDNLKAAIDNVYGNSTGAGTKYVALSSSDAAKIKNAGVQASVDSGDITFTGYGSLSASVSSTSLTAGTERKQLLAGLRNSTHLALPSRGYMVDEITQVPRFTGSELRSTQIFDSTVWTKNKDRIVRVDVGV